MIEQLPFQFGKDHHLFIQGDKVATTDNTSMQALLELRRILGYLPEIEYLPPKEFDTALQAAYVGRKGSSAQVMEDLEDVLDIEQATTLFDERSDLLATDDDAPLIRLLNSIFVDALKKNASDIHIESYEHEARVRFRLDGSLVTVLNPPVQLLPRLISRIKILAKLNIAEKRIPQDGRFTVQLGERAIDFRISSLPAAHGERIVLRLLEQQADQLKIEDLGMGEAERAVLETLISRPHGMLLVTGPTGSGKTTTLYASLQSLDQTNLNIMTVEDPVEYSLPGISQTPIVSKIGMTFVKGLRAILRQDPDVVLVGEIRDRETADIATQASLTGHLVLSTLHTNTAAGAVMRMQDIGVDSFMLASTLRGVVAQRLVRLLCQHCKQPQTVDDGMRKRFSVLADWETIQQELKSVYQSTGCEHCNYTGYIGRKALFEVVPVTTQLQQMIHDEVGELAMESLIRQSVPSLHQRGLELVIKGGTTIDEVIRVSVA